MLSHRCSGLESRKIFFLIVLAIMVFLTFSTYLYSPGLKLQWVPKKAEKEDVNGIVKTIETEQDINVRVEMNETQPNIFAQRLERVQQVCDSHPHLEGSVNGIFTHPSGIIYCFVPKAGCTFWKRIFNFAALKNNTSYKNPWSIPRLLVHTNNLRAGYPYKEVEHSPTKFPMRFMVSRDPFSRLVSSYLDKFYLPDFWYYLGRPFSKNTFQWSGDRKPDFMTRHFDLLQSMFDKSKTKLQQVQCGKRLTFAEFVTSLIKKPESHWMPVHRLCNPCKFKPTHIVHIESFESDSRVILQRMGLDTVMEEFTHDEQVNEEIQTIVDYNFRRLTDGPNAKELAACTTTKELAYRLWENFLWRGYIHPDVNYTIPDSSICVKDDLLKQLWRARIKGLQDREAMKAAAKKFKSDLYSTLDNSMYTALDKTFEMDFQFFGYKSFLTKKDIPTLNSTKHPV